MKSGLILAALAQLTLAQPHRAHHHQHKRQVDYVTKVDIVTAQAAVVYVNADGVPVSTSFPAGAAATAVPEQVHSIVANAAPAKPTDLHLPSVSVVPSSSAASSSAAPSATGGSGSTGISAGTSGLGLAYSPYNADSSCKTQDQVNQEFEMIIGYSYIRIYGVDCNQVTTVGNAAKAKGMKLMAGVYDINAVSSELSTMIQAVNGDFSHISHVTIGNEEINSGTASVSQVVSAIQQARTQLTAAGYSGPIATVDTGSVMSQSQYSQLCEASDFAGVNIHAFFDADALAADAGPTVMQTVQSVGANCPGKEVIVCESGYPYQGETNGLAVPSVANQIAAITSLKSTFSKNLFLFSAFDDMWKTNSAGTFGAEQFWGIISHATTF